MHRLSEFVEVRAEDVVDFTNVDEALESDSRLYLWEEYTDKTMN